MMDKRYVYVTDGMAITTAKCTLQTLLNSGKQIVRNAEDYVNRVLGQPISFAFYNEIKPVINYIGVTDNFRETVDYFHTPEGETPAGFRTECSIDTEGVLLVDLVRDISCGKNGVKRPTNVLFSADSANPYEVAPIKDLIANLTCNPGIIYDLFINNPEANVDRKFKNRDEVMAEIGRILGPGVDISVELNDPFGVSPQQILEEAAKFKEILSPYRVVIKVPHTGPVNADNVGELLTGDRKLQRRYDEGKTADMFRGHNMALLLREHGYRVNFTLMFEPYQTALALQAKPYFINTFLRHRYAQSYQMKSLLQAYEAGKDEGFLKQLRAYMADKDYFSALEAGIDLNQVKETAARLIDYRKVNSAEGRDGLDAARHSLRVLRQANLPDTRLIICSMEGPKNYPAIDEMLMEDEFSDMVGRVVITAEPSYLAQFTTCNQVVSYQRRFMNAVNGQC
jgi:transaldolase